MKHAKRSSDQPLDAELSTEELALVQGGQAMPQRAGVPHNPSIIIDTFGGGDPRGFTPPFPFDPIPVPVDPSPTFPVDPIPFPVDPSPTFPFDPSPTFPVDPSPFPVDPSPSFPESVFPYDPGIGAYGN